MNKRRVRRGGRGGARKFLRPEKGKYKPMPKSNTLPGLRAPNWNELNLEPFQKNFYREHPNVMNRLRQDVERFRNKHEITVQGLALNPIESFDEVFMPDYVAREIRNQGYSRPTPIQSQTWPIAFSGYNLVGIAQTGSGKTLAYILPAIIHINNQPNIKPGDGPIAVVLAPTRELATQIQKVSIEFGTSTHIRTVATVGGVDRKPQEADLLKGCEIVVATPGRLLDFLSGNVTNMKRCTYLVLDEADRMLDMGFEAQIREIISQIRPDKQILMWSATWPREIRQLAEDFLGHYIQVNIGSLELSANHNIKQFVHICQENEKSAKLQLLLRQIYQANNPGKILIFVSKKKRADMISKYINNFGVACESLHGDKPQSQRTKILDDFRSGRSNIIVATDVAARGLDIEEIMYVINLDFPRLIEDYVHRIGRCGRCDRMGISYAFFTINDAKQAKELIAILNEANQPVDAKLQEIAFNPKKPEKIDKKQRRLNENSGFTVALPEKRRYDDRQNLDDAGPSSSSGRGTYMEEPERKRERIVEPQPQQRDLMFNRNIDRNFRDDRNSNRGYDDIPSTACNPDRADEQNIVSRHFNERNNVRFENDDRDSVNDDRDFLNDERSRRQQMQRRRTDFESKLQEMRRAQQRSIDGMDQFRGEGSINDLQRSSTFQRGERPVDQLDQFRVAGEGSMNDHQRGPVDRMNELRMPGGRSMNNEYQKPLFPIGSSTFQRGEPVIGLDRMRNIPETSFDQREMNDFGRLNDFRDRSDDRMTRDYFDDVQRPIRHSVLDGRDHDTNRSGPMFNSSVPDRRNFERDIIDSHDIFADKALNLQDNLNNRTFDPLPERRSVSQEFRRKIITPDRVLDRSNDRFLDQSRDDEPFESLQHFGSRRGEFRDQRDTLLDLDERRSDFIDDINPPISNRWNDFSTRNAYPQDRRGINNDVVRRRNDFDEGGRMGFNSARNNDFDDDDFRNRDRRDFDRRDVNDRFNRFSYN